eukprot:1079370-Prymnesium_polylepis.1
MNSATRAMPLARVAANDAETVLRPVRLWPELPAAAELEAELEARLSGVAAIVQHMEYEHARVIRKQEATEPSAGSYAAARRPAARVADRAGGRACTATRQTRRARDRGR